jgi:uncharacterized protein YbcC (UPF0753/DUF2309 family)
MSVVSEPVPEAAVVAAEIREQAELLPLQGPITAFAFLNPLQGLEHLPVFDALRQARAIFGCEPYLRESEYRDRVARGRITAEDVQEILQQELGVERRSVAGLIELHEMRLSQLLKLVYPVSLNELDWVLAEADSLRRFQSTIPLEHRERLLNETRHWLQMVETSGESAALQLIRSVYRGGRREVSEQQMESICAGLLWKICLQRLESVSAAAGSAAGLIRLRDAVLAVTGQDPDELVHDVLSGFCAGWLDQGYAQWQMPNRDSGFVAAFCAVYGQSSTGQRRWLRGLPEALQGLCRGAVSPVESICQSLSGLAVGDADRRSLIRQSLLALRGWAGMLWQTETRPDRVFRSSPNGTLTEFLAVRLILDRLAAEWLIREHSGGRKTVGDTVLQAVSQTAQQQPLELTARYQAFVLLQLAELHGWSPQQLFELSEEGWSELAGAAVAFDQLERRRVLHLAFEQHLSRQALDAVSRRATLPLVVPQTPQVQIVTCIDAREESFRRYLEEVCPEIETFGNAGFFCVPMYYRGAAEATFTALCPVVIRPQNWIVEDVVYSLEDSHRQRAVARRILGRFSQRFDSGSRSSVSGALLTALLGPLATVPLLGRILFPHFMAQMHSTAGQFVAPPAVTRLRLERPEGVPAGPHDDGIGFTLTEMVTMSERSLRDIGLTSGFAPLVIFMGHGSSCMNNPHESAYHCGACSGSPGGANGRALAAMLNDPRVRRRLRERGLDIPDETWFIGGLHNTATEEITFFDLELLPSSHVGRLRKLRGVLAEACQRNAQERCRRFDSAPLEIDQQAALLHVRERSEDLAQTRPEYGNCTNAVCFVGRRGRLRGLFLDRRSFMMSYDRAQDTTDSMILARILGAVIPVCEGINLLYTLSAIDNRGWGSGTKLPHNVTSLLGVMDGASSDLRPGLPWQGVDIHEPVRLLFIIETTAESMLQIMDRNPNVAAICRNGWVQLAVLDPQSSRIQRFLNGRFEDYEPRLGQLSEVAASREWYAGRRDHLPFALIRPQLAVVGAHEALAE